MSEEINYDDFITHSPWIGEFRFFTQDGKYYRQLVTGAEGLVGQVQPKEIHEKLYEAAYNQAARTIKAA